MSCKQGGPVIRGQDLNLPSNHVGAAERTQRPDCPQETVGGCLGERLLVTSCASAFLLRAFFSCGPHNTIHLHQRGDLIPELAHVPLY